MAEFNQVDAIKHYTELMRTIDAGAYQERDVDGSFGEDGIEESIDNLETLALQNGLEFQWHKDTQTYTLEPMSPGDIAARKDAIEQEQEASED